MEHSPKRDTALSLSGCRILIVEDDFFIRIDLESILSDAGAEVVGPCGGVDDALEVLSAEEVTAAILDVRLGSETVAPVARELNKRGKPFMSYSGQVGMDPTLTEWPNSQVLAKPASPQAIVAAMSELLRAAQWQ